MIDGVHLPLFSRDPDADRTFFRDLLGFASIDAGEGWLIFELPPAELGIHPVEGELTQRHADQNMAGCVIYLMCDDLSATTEALRAKGATTTEIQQTGWGSVISIQLPSGASIGLYQPRHATALHLGRG